MAWDDDILAHEITLLFKDSGANWEEQCRRYMQMLAESKARSVRRLDRHCACGNTITDDAEHCRPCDREQRVKAKGQAVVSAKRPLYPPCPSCGAPRIDSRACGCVKDPR